MGTKKISQLNDGVAVAAGDLVEISRGGNTFKAPLGTMAGEDSDDFSSSTLLGDLIVSVKDPAFGAVGDGTTDDTAAIQAAIDFCFGSSGSPHESSTSLNRPLYFPPGQYKITAALVFTRVNGGKIFGAGRTVSRIIQATSNLNCITVNGMVYTTFSDMWFEASGASARVFDLSWDGNGGVALQEVKFDNCYFDGNGTALRGIDIGRGGFMGSECVILNCFVDSCVQGIRVSNQNALQNQVIGGNIFGCSYGIRVASGSIPVVSNVGFQSNTTYDIQVDNSADNLDTMTVIGCRTESDNFFAALANALPVNLVGITQTTSNNGLFVDSQAQARINIIGCGSKAGQISATNPKIYIFGSKLDRSSTFSTGFFGSGDYVEIHQSSIAGSHVRERLMIFDSAAGSGFLQRDWGQYFVKTITAATITLTSQQYGFRFDNSGASAQVAATLPTAVAGARMSFYVATAQNFRIIPASGDDIRIGGIGVSSTGSSGHIDCATIGGYVELYCRDATHWIAEAVVDAANWTIT